MTGEAGRRGRIAPAGAREQRNDGSEAGQARRRRDQSHSKPLRSALAGSMVDWRSSWSVAYASTVVGSSVRARRGRADRSG